MAAGKKASKQDTKEAKATHDVLLRSAADQATAEHAARSKEVAARQAATSLHSGKDKIAAAVGSALDAAAAAAEVHSSVHTAEQRATQAEEATQAALKTETYKITHEVSYGDSLLDVDVGTFEKVLAKLSGVAPTELYVDVWPTADSVVLKSTIFAPATKQLLHSLTRAEHPLIILSKQTPLVVSSPITQAALSGYTEARAAYEAERKAYDEQCAAVADVDEPHAVAEAERKLEGRAKMTHKILEDACAKGAALEASLERESAEARRAKAEALALPGKAAEDAAAAEEEAFGAMKEYALTLHNEVELRGQAARLRREAAWTTQEMKMIHFVEGGELGSAPPPKPAAPTHRKGGAAKPAATPTKPASTPAAPASTPAKPAAKGAGCCAGKAAGHDVDDPAVDASDVVLKEGEMAADVEPQPASNRPESNRNEAPAPSAPAEAPAAAFVEETGAHVEPLVRSLTSLTAEPDGVAVRFDGFAWAPLRLILPENKVDAFLGLALAGVYNHSGVCGLVARELCLQDWTLLEKALIGLASRTSTPDFAFNGPLTPTALRAAIAMWASQLVALASRGLALSVPPAPPKPEWVGGIEVKPVALAIGPQHKRGDWASLAERLLVAIGRAAFSSSAQQNHLLDGLLEAWGVAAAPELVTTVGRDHLVRILGKNAAEYCATAVGAKSAHVISQPEHYSVLERDSSFLDALVVGAALLAWKMPPRAAALAVLEAFAAQTGQVADTGSEGPLSPISEGPLSPRSPRESKDGDGPLSPRSPRGEDPASGKKFRAAVHAVNLTLARGRSSSLGEKVPFHFVDTYLRAGSVLRQQVCDVLMGPSPHHRIDPCWREHLYLSLVEHRVFWTEGAISLFDASAPAPQRVAATKATLGCLGGAGFLRSFLEQVRDGKPAKWSSVSPLQASLRAILEHQHLVAKKLEAAEEEEASAGRRSESEVPGQADREAVDLGARVAADGGALEKELEQLRGSLPDLYRCVELVLGLSMRSDEDFQALLPIWTTVDALVAPNAALLGAALQFREVVAEHESGYQSRRDTDALEEPDRADERTIICMIRLFVEKPEALVGFQNLVPRVFDVYLAKGTKLRSQLVSMLLSSGKDRDVIERIAEDDDLVRQPFFWSDPGMKLFGGHADLKDPRKLRLIIDDALAQQPSILVAFLQQACEKAAAEKASGGVARPPEAAPGGRNRKPTITSRDASPTKGERSAGAQSHEAELGNLIAISLQALLAFVLRLGFDVLEASSKKGVLDAVEIVLHSSTYHYEHVYAPALDAWTGSTASSGLLDAFTRRFKNQLQKSATLATGEDHADAADEGDEGAEAEGAEEHGPPGTALTDKEKMRHECIMQTLASLFIAQPSQLTAFSQLVPRVFKTHLRLGTEPRNRLNELLLSTSFEDRLKRLIAETDELVGAPFFWNDQVMPLCTKERIAASYPRMNNAFYTKKDGGEIHLYSSLLALLLRLSSIRGGNSAEIARRTKEVLDQFERNEDQQQFILTVFETLESRSRETPDMFNTIQLTVLSEVAQNGVQTLSSVSGDKMELCEQAMTTLLRNYIIERDPAEWKQLFKEATNVGFMVKYMFRENLPLAKQKFLETVQNRENFRKMPHANEVQDMLSKLIDHTFAAYGEKGIYDPEKLAEIDFLNNPQLLVDLVQSSKDRMSRKGSNEHMRLMTDITTQWMQYMVDRKFPPLTPHHTQAFTVLMMSRCYEEYLSQEARKKNKALKKKLQVQAFIAQMATGEGKSIVIAMLAVFMVKLYGVRVHVLENNEGLLDRDFRQNQPFYERFGIKSSSDLGDEDAGICYCLKKQINKHFLRKMVEGKLDEELRNIVLIVDEVDDLVVNERPNNHYVKKDDEQSPDLIKCYEALKNGWSEKIEQEAPEGVEWNFWIRACSIVRFVEDRIKENKHYRIIKNDHGDDEAIMLDDQGNVPKVPLAAPWLQYVNYTRCKKAPVQQTRYACVCAPYIFNKYAGIFGLTGSVGGKEELQYLTKTYQAVKFDVPRFLDTCIGDARKIVTNHGVELVEGQTLLVDRVVDLCKQYYRNVPVLVIASNLDEMKRLHHAVRDCGAIPSEEVQRFSEFDEHGRPMKEEWQTIIDDSTKRLGGMDDNRCRVTVTDRFGGRGHDFQVVDREANANGGMLVIATSIPDEREWIQWRGRTARQDRPGQFYVILDKTASPFTDPQQRRLSNKISKMPSEDGKIEELLDVADDGIGDKLKEFEGEQASGEKLNELTEKYYTLNPRGFDEPWPLPKYAETDKVLRNFLTVYVDYRPEEIRKLAKEQLKIELS